jgi:hypothetical protein
MYSPFIIPLACFAMVVLIVAITQMVKMRDKEMEVHQKLHHEQLDHERQMKELDLELTKLRMGGSSGS